MAAYCIALFFFVAYFSPMFIPPNQLTVHRGAAVLRPINTLKSRFGFQLKHLDLSRSDQTTAGHLFLFVPGHKGNVKQAISMTKFFEKQGLLLDMYSVDFLEGASALSAELLRSESEFISDCLSFLSQSRTGRISIITHSMGGVVVSIALGLPQTPLHRIAQVIALSSPLTVPPVSTDVGIAAVYRTMHTFWTLPKAQNVFLLTFAGGIRDLTIPAHDTSGFSLRNTTVAHFYTTEMENLHLELDHMALVWGLEFFTQLTKALKVLLNERENAVERLSMELDNRLGKMLYSDAATTDSETTICREQPQSVNSGEKLAIGSVYRVDWRETVITAASRPEIYLCKEGKKVNLVDFQLDSAYVSLLRLEESSEAYIKPTGDTQLQPLLSPHTSQIWLYSFLCKHYFPMFPPSSLLRLRPGSQFSSPRFPLHISIHCDNSQIKAAHIRCGTEDIVKFNENDFTVYLSEECADGPEIYLLGFDQIHKYEVAVGIHWTAALVVFVRDFRMHVISSTIFFFLLQHSDFSMRLKSAFLAVVLAGILLFEPILRVSGSLFPYDSVKSVSPLSISELLFIGFVGNSAQFALFCLISYCYSLFRRISHCIHPAIYLVWVLIAPVSALFPWPYALISMLLSGLYDANRSPEPKPALLWAYLLMISSIPQIAGWFIVLFDHKVALPMSYNDGILVIPLVFAFLMLNIKSGTANKWISALTLLYVGLCSFEFPYRANTALAVGLFLHSLLAQRLKVKVE